MRSFVKTIALTYLLQFATTAVHALEPEQMYDGGFKKNGTIALRIGNGGAGQSGLIRELANAFISRSVQDGATPFRIAWYKSDTTESINYLKTGDIDVAITYCPIAEKIAIKQGVATGPSYYAWRDHFMLVGPPSNPAKLDNQCDISMMFSDLYRAAENGGTDPPVKFLTRFDKSATNIKDSELFIMIGQVPWASKYSDWYHQSITYPIQALTTAAHLQEYTLTDRGTYLSVDKDVRDKVMVYKAGSDDADDPLLNPAHLLIGKKAKDMELANKFAKWLVSPAGQAVITGFKKDGEQLYSGAPA
ncbi:ribosome biogenesis protein BMS1 [[Emmonsia] crescens]|uniref:Ribosome biogenesis protein BMS1 n=1 Tax=[Emmonsia] crescens TaxID=73230 RepID=A0A2B7ZJA6_9EURO|nr:ribosome biogenesis protein BMS1 [Emmonsia crescens]